MRVSRLLPGAVLATGLVVLVGCGDDGPSLTKVSGTVELDGQPLADATVTFVPEDPLLGPTASGFTDSGGGFFLRTGTRPGTRPGKYKVVVFTSQAEEPGVQKTMQQAMEEKFKGGGGGGMPKAADAGKLLKESNKASHVKKVTAVPEVYSNDKKTPLSATVPQPEYKFDLHKDGR